jgi:hypothetical protein
MRRLKRNKSAGLDGIKVEFLLDASDMLHVPLFYLQKMEIKKK